MPACVKLLSSALSQTTNEADSAANLPLLLSYEADRAAILLPILKYYADSAAILAFFLQYEPISLASASLFRFILLGFRSYGADSADDLAVHTA